MRKIYQVLVIIMVWTAGPAAAEIIELRCVTNEIDSEGNIEAVPDIDDTPNFLVFNTSDRSVQYALWPSASATHWDDEIIAWTMFSEEYMRAAAFMFNRSSGLLLVEVVSSWHLQRVEDGRPIHANSTIFNRCTRTF